MALGSALYYVTTRESGVTLYQTVKVWGLLQRLTESFLKLNIGQFQLWQTRSLAVLQSRFQTLNYGSCRHCSPTDYTCCFYFTSAIPCGYVDQIDGARYTTNYAASSHATSYTTSVLTLEDRVVYDCSDDGNRAENGAPRQPIMCTSGGLWNTQPTACKRKWN